MTQDNKYELYDMHSHIFPAKIADKATTAIGKFYDIPMCHEGDSESLIKSGSKIGVDKYLVCSSATTPAQVESINSFIAAECKLHPEFIGFGTLHPMMESFEAEIERMVSLGLVGVKLHPDFQAFQIDCDRAIEMYKIASRYKLPFLFHTGDNRYDYSSPKRLANAMDKVPELVAIGAHLGGYSEWEEVPSYLLRPNVYFDTSSTLFSLNAERASELIHILGVDKFFFGVDFPMWDHEDEMSRFSQLTLTEDEKKGIFADNAKRFFKKHTNL